MVVMINIPEELASEAKARGMSPEAYVEDLLQQQVTLRLSGKFPVRSPEEIRAWLDSLAQFSDKIPPLPDLISRAWIYEDHD